MLLASFLSEKSDTDDKITTATNFDILLRRTLDTMPSQQSPKWLTTFLAIAAIVAALPAHQKRDLGDWVTATIDGQVVSWQNDYSGAAPTTAPVSAPVTSDAATTTAPTAQTGGGAVWVYATINGQEVSWVNNWPPPAASTDAPTPASATSNASPTPASTTAVPDSLASADYVYATINGVLVSWINNWPPPASTSTPALAPTTTSTVASAPSSGPTNAASCKDVHIFIAKGNNEPYPGRQGTLVDDICNDLPSCDYENILFENTHGEDYCAAVTEGSANGVNQMIAYGKMCPLSKLVASGYSQGTDVIGNILGGGGSVFGTQKCIEGFNAPIDFTSSPGSQIGAITLFGNTRHVANQPYNYLNGSGYSSDNPRSFYPESLAQMNLYSDIIRDYCDETDPVCCTEGLGPFVIDNHLNYFDRYSSDAATWIKSKLGY